MRCCKVAYKLSKIKINKKKEFKCNLSSKRWTKLHEFKIKKNYKLRNWIGHRMDLC